MLSCLHLYLRPDNWHLCICKRIFFSGDTLNFQLMIKVQEKIFWRVWLYDNNLSCVCCYVTVMMFYTRLVTERESKACLSLSMMDHVMPHPHRHHMEGPGSLCCLLTSWGSRAGWWVINSKFPQTSSLLQLKTEISVTVGNCNIFVKGHLWET